MKSSYKSFCANQRGNTTIIYAMSVLPMLLAAGAGIDMVRANRAQAMLQAAADAAALSAGAADGAAVIEGNVDLNQVVQDFVASNNVGIAVDTVEAIESIKNNTAGTLQVRVRGRMNTFLMRLGGIESMDLEALAEVALGSRAMEVALVLDNTGSMAGAKIDDLKSAARNLVGILHTNKADFSSLKIGVVPYSEYVNVGLTPPGGTWRATTVVPAGSTWEGCIGSRPSPLDETTDTSSGAMYPSVGDVHCVTSLLPLTDNRGTVESKINAMTAEGNTYIPAGLLWGWNILTNAAPYAEGYTAQQMLQLRGTKAIILMTDGENTIHSTGQLHDGASPGDADMVTSNLCNAAKADGITIFTVAFQVPSVAAKNMLEACASSADMAFDAQNSAALDQAFSAIGTQLSSLYLAK
jgi:Flp pilus assembly protein TadG